MSSRTSVVRRFQSVAFNTGFGPLVRREAERLQERLEHAEDDLRLAERESNHWSALHKDERLRLRVELQERREWVDFERYRLERLHAVTRIPWWRVSKRRRVLGEIEYAEAATARA